MENSEKTKEIKGLYFDDIDVGMSEQFSKIISDDDIVQFADVSGDVNPLHLDETYAKGTVFKQRIAHGMLTASFLSTIFGTKLPGPGCIYVSQSLNFRRPVKIGDEVIAQAHVKEVLSDQCRVIMECSCTVNGKTVLDGEAVLMVPQRGQ